MAITAETRTDIIDLVVAALDVAPGTTLLSELVAIVDGGGTLADVAANLTARTDYLAKYPTFQTANEWATEWLGNLIPEADSATMAAAVTIAEGMVNSGSTQAAIIVEAASFLAGATADATYGTVATAFVNNSSVAAYHTVTKENAAIGTSTLTGVDSTDASVTTAKASVDTVTSTVAAETYTLTKDLDSKVLGAGDDTANSANTATTTTLNSGDSIAGGDGSDTISITNTSANAALGAGATVSAVEKVSVNAVAATTLDMTLFSGVTDIFNNGSLSALTLSGVGSYIPNVHLTAANADTTVTWASAATTVGTSDAMTVALSAASTTSSATLTAAGIETFNVLASTASGSATNTQTISSTSARTVAVTGDATTNITVDLAGAGATDALAGSVSGNGAANIFSITADSTDKVSVDLGAGDDTLTMSTIGALFTLAGGDGADTLKLTQAVATGAAASATISGFSTLNISDAGTGTIDIDDFEGGITKVVYDAGLGGATTVDDAVTGVEVEVDVTTAAQNLTVDLKTDGSTDAITVTLDAIGAGDNIGAINASDAETLTITVDDDTTTATGTIGIASITLGDATTATISGDAATTITTFTNPTTPVLTAFNAGGMTDTITLSGLNLAAAGATITLGSANDSLTMGTGDGADTIDLSAGGNNTVTYTAVAQSDAAGMDTIKGFVSGSDDLDLTGLTLTTTSLFGGVGASKTAAEGLLAATTNPVAVFQADDSILWIDSNTDNLLNAGDFRIKLEGLSTIAATDFNLATSGNTSAATAAAAVLSTSVSTNMSALSSNENDTISSTSAFAVGSTFDGGLGTDAMTFTLTTGGTTTVDLDDAAGDIENIESVTVSTGITQLNLLAADIAGNTGGEIATLAGTSATSQTLLINTGDVILSGLTNTNFETISANDSGGAGITVTIDTANLTDVDRLVLDDGNAGTADTLTLAGGNYDFTNIDLDFDDAGVNNVLTIDTVDALGGTITLDDADVDNVGVITGEATAGVITTIATTGDLDLSAMALTEIDTFTIAGANTTLTIDGDDATALATAETAVGVTVTGSGTSNLTFAVGAGGAALSLADFTITGVDAIDVSAATAGNDLDLDAASVSGAFTLTANSGDDLTFTEDATYSTMTIPAGDFDEITLDASADVTLSELAFTGTSTIAQVLGTAGGDTETLGVTIGTAGTVTFDALATITNANMTITDSSGNDTITLVSGADNDAAMDNLTIALGTGGADTVNIDNHSHNGTDATGLTVTGFTAGIGTGADKLAVTLTDNVVGGTVYTVVSSAGTALADIAAGVYEIASSLGTVSDLTAVGAGGAVEVVLANAFGTSTANNSGGAQYMAIIYGSGAAAGSAGIYEVETSSNNADVTAATETVELVAVLSGGITADALVQANFI